MIRRGKRTRVHFAALAGFRHVWPTSPLSRILSPWPTETETLAKALAVRSLKLANEQHGEVNEALDRLVSRAPRPP